MLRFSLQNSFLIILILFSFIIPLPIFAESDLLITKSVFISKEVEFDGIWTNHTEWKRTSLKEIETQNGSIYLRFAHQEDFVYFFVDVVADKTLDKNSDKTILCFDTLNDKNIIPNEDDYCFVSVLGKSNGFTLQGGSFISTQNFLKKITNHKDFVAIGNVSDENDRYSKVPHSSYEFRIPTDVINRNNVYGFYMGVFDQSEQTLYTWPDIESHHTKIPSPSIWGNLVSPDNSLPEFNIPMLSVIFGIVGTLLILQLKNKSQLNFGTISP